MFNAYCFYGDSIFHLFYVHLKVLRHSLQIGTSDNIGCCDTLTINSDLNHFKIKIQSYRIFAPMVHQISNNR